jgi:Golgi apyrase
MDGLSDEEEHSDSSASGSGSGSGSKGKTSGWATPSVRTPKSQLSTTDLLSGVSAGTGTVAANAMERSGLFVRTDSRERLSGLGMGEEWRSRSRRPSPPLSKRSIVE